MTRSERAYSRLMLTLFPNNLFLQVKPGLCILPNEESLGINIGAVMADVAEEFYPYKNFTLHLSRHSELYPGVLNMSGPILISYSDVFRRENGDLVANYVSEKKFFSYRLF